MDLWEPEDTGSPSLAPGASEAAAQVMAQAHPDLNLWWGFALYTWPRPPAPKGQQAFRAHPTHPGPRSATKHTLEEELFCLLTLPTLDLRGCPLGGKHRSLRPPPGASFLVRARTAGEWGLVEGWAPAVQGGACWLRCLLPPLGLCLPASWPGCTGAKSAKAAGRCRFPASRRGGALGTEGKPARAACLRLPEGRWTLPPHCRGQPVPRTSCPPRTPQAQGGVLGGASALALHGGGGQLPTGPGPPPRPAPQRPRGKLAKPDPASLLTSKSLQCWPRGGRRRTSGLECCGGRDGRHGKAGLERPPRRPPPPPPHLSWQRASVRRKL